MPFPRRRPYLRPPRPRRRRARRGIYLLPSLFTVGNVFAGYYAIIAAHRGSFSLAGVLIIVAAVLDSLDGRVARMTGTSTEFGLQFDSLADVISFGIAPALLVYSWGLQELGRVGWVASFLFVICGAMRLARFNIQTVPDKRFFIGLPIPAAALVIATLAFYHPQQVLKPGLSVAVLILVLLLSGLMVSRLRYTAFKSFDHGGRQSFLIVGFLALLLAGIAIDPQIALLAMAILYLLSGLVPRAPGLERTWQPLGGLGETPPHPAAASEVDVDQK